MELTERLPQGGRLNNGRQFLTSVCIHMCPHTCKICIHTHTNYKNREKNKKSFRRGKCYISYRSIVFLFLSFIFITDWLYIQVMFHKRVITPQTRPSTPSPALYAHSPLWPSLPKDNPGRRLWFIIWIKSSRFVLWGHHISVNRFLKAGDSCKEHNG